MFIILLQNKKIFEKTQKKLDRTQKSCYNIKAVRNAAIAQQVERILGKDEVSSSNLDSSSTENPVTAMVAGSFVVRNRWGS